MHTDIHIHIHILGLGIDLFDCSPRKFADRGGAPAAKVLLQVSLGFRLQGLGLIVKGLGFRGWC